MDYDEKDFQSHNFQLVGEDKFSTNLRSFALPRFDIDEHLRFDSLVEEEVLLGIQGQENNWIDFPPGSGAIEFSSSAAESCSITRDNNVWSEATSSESVDLLLKSVGEDEMINNKFIMETSANEESHGIDNQADLYVEKDDSHESSMMDVLPVDPELAQDKLQEDLSGSNEGQREMLPNAEGSSQAAAGEESRIAMYIHSSNRKFSSDGKIAGVLYTIGDHISFCNAIEKSKVDDKDLCEAVLNEKDVCEVLMRTEAPSIDDSNSCEVDNQSLESNQDVKLYMETEKLNTGLFSVGQDQRNISNSSDFLCDDAHTEKSLVVYNDDKKNHDFVLKSGSLVPLNTKCIGSVFHENSDVSAVAVPCQTKSLNCNSETCENFFTEECMSQLAMEQEGKIEHNSVTASSKAILKRLTQLAEGYSSVGDRLPNDSVEDVHGIRTQLIKNSALSCDDRGVTLETCINSIDNKQYPEGHLVERRSTVVENATPLLTDSPDSIHVNYETQVTDNEDCKRMNTNPLSFTCDKSGLVVEGNSDKDMDVDRQEVKLDETKDAAPDESLPISVTDESALLITMTDTESRTSPSTYCKSSVCMEAISVTDLTEVHRVQVHVSVDKDPSLTYMGPGRINSSPVSKVMEKVQDLPPAVREAAEELSLDGSANKLVEEGLDCVPLSLEFEESSSLLLSTPEHATNVDLAVGKEESLIQVSPANTIHSDGNDIKISGVVVSSLSTTDLVVEKESDLASVSYPLNMKDASPEKIPQGDSAAQLISPVKSLDSQLSKCTGGLNMTMEQKDEPSSCLTIPDSCASEENEMKLSGGSMLSNSRKNVDKETVNGAVTGSDCVEYALVDSSTEHLPLAVVQPPSPVRSSCFTVPQNDIPSSAGNAVGSGKALLLERNGISHASSWEGNDDILNSLEVVSHAMTDASLALAQTANGRQALHMPPSMDKECSCKSPSNAQKDQYKLAERDVSDGQNVSAQTEDNLLNKRMNDSSQICTGSTAESNSSEAQSGNSSSERNFVSPIVSNCIGSPGDASAHNELKVSGNMSLVSSEKDEITHKVDCSSGNLHVTSVDDRSFTFEVSTSEDLPERGDGIEPSFHNLKANDIPQTPNENSLGLPEDVKVLGSSSRTHNQGKSKNASRPSNEKTTASKGKPKKEPHALKQSSALDVKYSSFTSKSDGTLSKDIPLVEMQEHSSNECSTIKSSSSLAIKTSSIPDLNSSSSLALFHQPFTDLQQVQLRAQIFVYGALISGMPPDETYMVSAFRDGGRNLWEGLWHASIVRFQNQKSPVGSYDTPSSRPAIWIPEQVSVGSDVQSKVPSTSSAKSDSIVISSTVLNSTVPLPSPLWSLSYGNDGQHASLSRGTYLSFSHSPSPVAHQTSVSRQHVGANSPWLSQSPRPGPWSVSSQISALDGITRYSTVPVTETGHVMPIRDSCGPHTPTVQVGHPGVLMSAPDIAATTTASDLQIDTSKREATSGNNKYTPITQKARKRKKGEAAEEPTLPASQSLAESVSALSVVENLPLPSVSVLLSSNSQLNVASHAPVSISTPHIIYPTHYQIIGTNNNQQKAILSEETCSKIEQAKLQAENATALAASTVKHSQDIWSQLAAQKNSGLSSQFEEKLASAAVAAAAAASVAKAAAAAANVAFGAALQAKMMADEAMSAAKAGNTAFNQESGILDVGKKLAGISPGSILKGMDKIHGSGAIISAASEAARKKVESASAAMKRAENLNSILKAAELAAEAVAQAGTIIAMGDPLPFTLRDLVDAGPEGFWRGHDGASTKLSKASSMHGEEHLGLGSANEHGGSDKKLEDQFSKDKDTQKVADEGVLSYLNECHEQFEGRSQGNFFSAGHEKEHPVIFSSIQKGSVVEVMSNGDGLKGAWFLARVLDMNDNRAYVCYNDVSTTEGLLKEWIVLEKGEKAPRIRTAHSTTLMKYEGTRKRRREHLGSYIWEVGDHVDAWMHDRWWEGTVTEKSPGDETKLTVHIPARDDTHVVNSWNLRPSLIWKDGQWSEWSHAKEKSFKAHEGDTPQEKRQRLGRLEAKNHSEVDASGMGKLSKNILIEESRKPDDSRSLALSAKDRTFSIGKNSREEVISDARKPKQTGLQKEGSRVVFGVPRPGKKRKFMEVSKHYVANKSEKSNEGNDSIKFAKYLMPQASRQSRNTSKVDNKGRKAVEIKPRGGFKAENYQSFRTRGLAEKDKASLPTSTEGTVHVYHKDVTSSFKAVESEYSVQPAPVPLSKKSNTPGSETDLAVKPKSSMDGTSTVDNKDPGNPGKAMHEIMEPRRSNRRIQPTSRLLEGLQSSLVISKISGVSHERKLPRGGSVSRGNLR